MLILFTKHILTAAVLTIMNIDSSIRELGSIDIEALREAILAQEPAAWRENEQRQEEFEVHRQTESIVLVFCEGDYPELEVAKHSGWDRLAPLALPIMHDLIARHYPPGGTIIRAMAAKLLAGGKITPHFDSAQTFRRSHRIHVPITTNPRVRLTIDGRPHRLAVGQAYEINNQQTHSVINSGRDERITFIFDYLPAEQIQGRSPQANQPAASTRSPHSPAS